MTPDFDAFYTPAQKAMQAAQGTEALANVVLQAIVSDIVEPPNAAFIESRDFFFLSTVDGEGRPTVSYKGGPPGVCAVLDEKTLAFPSYDGNGMFKSMGNAAETGKVGLLFIDFETPNRVRVQGDVTLSTDDPEMARWPGARMVARVAVESCFLNCARYIHKHTRVEASPYVPAADGSQPHPAWKRIDAVQEALPEEDRARTAEAGGPITQDDYVEKLMAGTS
ncbi:pyridoxamine 5'-phosphate oxidase family protein [Pontivivens ytuae]|uniref:Pyridoxamine 5'-phosphate oxidase family protein n=1 Tax=Pontivivens ytuae TaxID=2789856 RepID=A0A7S9LU60_9RHOB|nr:pyridoxamine 5'-phosphate oxidase family protein [Pontivivens ytuae]QPH54810.1 pyridoxamine 5'-phosphate oxidase family protein [Pontivivens ytuae]